MPLGRILGDTQPSRTYLIAILVLQVPAADGALPRGVRGTGTLLGSLCDAAFDLKRQKQSVSLRARARVGQSWSKLTTRGLGGASRPINVKVGFVSQ